MTSKSVRIEIQYEPRTDKSAALQLISVRDPEGKFFHRKDYEELEQEIARLWHEIDILNARL